MDPPVYVIPATTHHSSPDITRALRGNVPDALVCLGPLHGFVGRALPEVQPEQLLQCLIFLTLPLCQDGIVG